MPREKTSLAMGRRLAANLLGGQVPRSTEEARRPPRRAQLGSSRRRLTGRPRRSRRARPKSRTLTSPSAVTITFSGLRSPCTMPSAWAAAIPAAIWRAIDNSESSGSRLGLAGPGERFAGDVFHADDRNARRIVDGVDRAEVGMIERGRRAGLGQRGARRHRAVGPEDLECHRTDRAGGPARDTPARTSPSPTSASIR